MTGSPDPGAGAVGRPEDARAAGAATGAETVALVLPGQLRELAGGRIMLPLDGPPATVGEALERLRAVYPTVHERLVTERGELRPHINIFVGREDIRHTEGLETPLADATQIFVLPSVSGG